MPDYLYVIVLALFVQGLFLDLLTTKIFWLVVALACGVVASGYTRPLERSERAHPGRTSSMRRPSQYGINAAAGLIAVAVSAAASLIVTPFLIDRLGAARYGLWTLALAVVQLSILLDFGLTATSRRFQAASLTTGNTHDSVEILGVSLRLYVPLGLAGLALSVVLAAVVPQFESFAGDESREFQVLLVAAGIRSDAAAVAFCLLECCLRRKPS